TNIYFFISSRRRHTISKRDWSSDVCSSDLKEISSLSLRRLLVTRRLSKRRLLKFLKFKWNYISKQVHSLVRPGTSGRCVQVAAKIGRASCRERGEEQDGTEGLRIRTTNEMI